MTPFTDQIPTYAIKENVFRTVLMNGEAVVTPNHDDAVAKIELWSCEPGFIYLQDEKLMMNRSVDKLSLFLSLKDDPSERVQGELKRMTEQLL